MQISNSCLNLPINCAGQTSYHSTRGEENGVTVTPKKVLERYRLLGFHYVCLTVHSLWGLASVET